MFQKFFKDQKGQLLIESIIAISLATVGILGILFTLNRSFSINREVRERFIAANLAAEGIEIVKNIIDTNIARRRPWNAGINKGDFELAYDSARLTPAADRFLKLDANGFYNYLNGSETAFKRTIRINLSNDGNMIEVNSIVKNRDSGFEVNLEDRFYNWR